MLTSVKGFKNNIKFLKNDNLMKLIYCKSSSFVFRENFASRHIGITRSAQENMLKKINVKTVEELISKTVPQNIRLNRELNLNQPLSICLFFYSYMSSHKINN